MENDERSKMAARLLCEKHPDQTLCIEWNPQGHQWRAATKPDGQVIDRASLRLKSQEKFVLAGHYREGGTMAALSPEELAAQVRLMNDLGVRTPRQISLTGVCYTAPQLEALDEAAKSLAGRFVSALHKAGMTVPVTSIAGEVTVNEEGRKEVVLHKQGRSPAILHKVILSMDKDGRLIANAPVLTQKVAMARMAASDRRPEVPVPLDPRVLKRLQRMSADANELSAMNFSNRPGGT